jgi:hypothetical protein
LSSGDAVEMKALQKLWKYYLFEQCSASDFFCCCLLFYFEQVAALPWKKSLVKQVESVYVCAEAADVSNKKDDWAQIWAKQNCFCEPSHVYWSTCWRQLFGSISEVKWYNSLNDWLSLR